jgi:hypothetical protein
MGHRPIWPAKANQTDIFFCRAIFERAPQKKIKAPGGPRLFIGFFTVKIFFLRHSKKRASDRHRRPVLTSETTKRKMSNIFSLIACCLGDSSLALLKIHSSLMPFCYDQPYSTRHFPDKINN